jgi:hypothetical protein
VKAGLVKGEKVFADSTLIRANASLKSIVPRAEAHFCRVDNSRGQDASWSKEGLFQRTGKGLHPGPPDSPPQADTEYKEATKIRQRQDNFNDYKGLYHRKNRRPSTIL